MNQEESLSVLTQKPSNAKNAIIQKLSKQWPLTPKQLSNALKREFGLNITYQAVHKALHELEKEHVVQKTVKGYQFHENWIQQILQVSQSIAQNYSRNEPLDFNKEIIQLHFKNWISAGRFVCFEYNEQTPNPGNKPIVFCWKHVWPVNTVSIEETQRLSEVAKKENQYFLCPNKTPLDKTLAAFLEGMHKRNITGASISFDSDYGVKGDHIVHIYYPRDLAEKIDLFYRETKDLHHVDYKRMQKLVTEKTEVYVVIIKNAKLAEKMRNEAMIFFNRKRDRSK